MEIDKEIAEEEASINALQNKLHGGVFRHPSTPEKNDILKQLDAHLARLDELKRIKDRLDEMNRSQLTKTPPSENRMPELI
jgi:hypothetical protein